ncbi:MAG TPA: PEP-CTERM sorting domain-containing protein [Phycisphaerae bacterium]|nr:PEP-CTERM sorting domain-containing protein [Phycisphaerae bacterium]
MLDGRSKLVWTLVLVGVLGSAQSVLGDIIWDLEGTGKVQVKAKGYKFRDKLPETVTVTMADDGTFLTDTITAGTWSMNTGKGNKVDVWVGEDDIAAIAAAYSDELGVVTIQLDGIKKFHLNPVITNSGMMKINLKLDGLVTIPELELEQAVFKVRGFYKGYQAPPAPGGDPDSTPEPASAGLLAAGALALLNRRRRR